METIIKSNAFAEKESVPFDEKEQSMPLDKQKEIFYKLVAGKTEDIEKLCISINFQNLLFYFLRVPRKI